MSEKRRPRTYTGEFIREAVRLVLEEKMVVDKVAQDLGIPENTLHGWVGRVKKVTGSLMI